MQTIGTSVASIFCTMNRSRSTISGRPSSSASVESHMFAWYADVVPPEKYIPVVGRYSASHPSSHASASSSPATRLPGSSRPARWAVPSSSPAQQPQAGTDAHTGSPDTAAALIPAVVSAATAVSRTVARWANSAGGAGESRSAEVSMLRVTTGSRRRSRTAAATAWMEKCRTQQSSTAPGSSAPAPAGCSTPSPPSPPSSSASRSSCRTGGVSCARRSSRTTCCAP